MGKGKKGEKGGPIRYVPVQDEHHNVRLPGRHQCECQARRHRLINNCLGCGRIVCDQEGSGPCFFCSNLVCTPDEEIILLAGGSKANALKTRLYGDLLTNIPDVTEKLSLASLGKDVEKAVQAKDRLLEFDRTSAKRSTIYDDEKDYFAMNNPWLTKEENAKLRRKYDRMREEKFMPRSQQNKFTLDFAGRQVVPEMQSTDMYEFEDGLHHDASEKLSNSEVDLDPSVSETYRKRARDIRLSYAPGSAENPLPRAAIEVPSGLVGSFPTRIRDPELLELRDEGMCLSMHQPWALLLVLGIKQHEGRSWYTAHRGRLWIAAGAKVPTLEEIRSVEHMYRVFHNNDNIVFPESYPTGCLLGYVDVLDCLPQEQYREQYPQGESHEPYVFICANPRALSIRYPLKGQHKIYKLDANILQAARKCIKM